MSVQLETSVPAPVVEAGFIRIYADASGAAELMAQLVSSGRLDAALGEEDGHWYVDVRDGDGVLRQIVDLVAGAVELGRLICARICVRERTFTFPPAGHGLHPATL